MSYAGLIAAGIAATIGTVQAVSGRKKSKEADEMGPDIIDPNRVAALEEAKRRQASFNSGTDTTTQQALKSADQSTRATQRDIAKNTGGHVAGTVSGLLQAQALGSSVKNKAFAEAGQRGLVMGNIANQISKEIEERKRDIQQFRSVQRRAEGAELQKQGFANMTGAGMSMAGGASSGGEDSSSNNQSAPTSSIFDSLKGSFNSTGQGSESDFAGGGGFGIGNSTGGAGFTGGGAGTSAGPGGFGS